MAASLALFAIVGAVAVDQFPSPMVEHTRAHTRLTNTHPPGRREKLSLGTLFVPELRPDRAAKTSSITMPLIVHFHGASWLAEVAAAQHRVAGICVNLGTGSSVYAKPFANPGSFSNLLDEAATKAAIRFEPVMLTAWSAGYGAVRQILRDPGAPARIQSILLLDGMHAGYIDGKPGPKESRLVEADLEEFVAFAREAAAGKKRFVITHTEIFPGTFASTTETADYLIRRLGLKRTAVLRWGPLGTQQLSEVAHGKLLILGYAGNSAPDHIDQLHALPEHLRQCGIGR
jgi:hypothetical protein